MVQIFNGYAYVNISTCTVFYVSKHVSKSSISITTYSRRYAGTKRKNTNLDRRSVNSYFLLVLNICMSQRHTHPLQKYEYSRLPGEFVFYRRTHCMFPYVVYCSFPMYAPVLGLFVRILARTKL